MELFVAQGFDRTTTAQIARAAGVTDRTFYRYYPDKRDVLFEGETAVRTLLVAAIASASPDLGPLDAVSRALRMFQSMLDAFRSFVKARHDLIQATPALEERQAMRTAVLIDVLGVALVGRGVTPLAAKLAAKASMAAFVVAAHAWLDADGLDLDECMDRSFAEMKALLAGMP